MLKAVNLCGYAKRSGAMADAAWIFYMPYQSVVIIKLKRVLFPIKSKGVKAVVKVISLNDVLFFAVIGIPVKR